MATLNEVMENLYSNPNLTNEVKENMDILIQLFHKNLPDVNLTYLSERLKTLTYESTSKYVTEVPLSYNKAQNKLVIVKSELEKDYDAKYLLMVALIEMMEEFEVSHDE